MSRFEVLKPPPAAAAPPAVPAALVSAPAAGTKRPDRAGKVMVGGHFSPELARAVKVAAAEGGTTVQALVGEALDLLLRQLGKHPFGER